jgi:catechol 2,3-dioxygenase-like lactoylglutathione lyase family enzyme
MSEIIGVRHAVLGVRDPQQSIAFYTDALGMELVTFLEDMQMGFLSFGEHDHDLAVIKVPDDQPVGSSALAHTAIEVNGGVDELQELYATFQARGVEVELTADHVLTKSFYLLDPDGNRLEFYAQLMPPTDAKRYLQHARVADDVLRPLDLAGPVGRPG